MKLVTFQVDPNGSPYPYNPLKTAITLTFDYQITNFTSPANITISYSISPSGSAIIFDDTSGPSTVHSVLVTPPNTSVSDTIVLKNLSSYIKGVHVTINITGTLGTSDWDSITVVLN